MKLITKAIAKQLMSNVGSGKERPVLKLFTPDAGATWLFVSAERDGNDLRLFGLCDLGLGMPELGYASLRELASVRGKFSLPIERDKWFTADKTLSEYADEARQTGWISA